MFELFDDGTGDGLIEDLPEPNTRCWVVADGPVSIYECSPKGEQVVAIATLTKEWRLSKGTMSIKVKPSSEDVYYRVSFWKTPKEKVDNTPVDFTVPPPLSVADEMRRLIRQELSEQMANQGLETLEESMDFDVADDLEWRSPYEFDDMQEEQLIETLTDTDGTPRGAPDGDNGSGGPEVESGGVHTGEGDSKPVAENSEEPSAGRPAEG